MIAFNTLAGQEFVIDPVDTVVLVLPSVAESELCHAFRARIGRWLLHRVGDCLSPRRLDSAVLEGRRVARATRMARPPVP